jgi:hypothetical protein
MPVAGRSFIAFHFHNGHEGMRVFCATVQTDGKGPEDGQADGEAPWQQQGTTENAAAGSHNSLDDFDVDAFEADISRFAEEVRRNPDVEAKQRQGFYHSTVNSHTYMKGLH